MKRTEIAAIIEDIGIVPAIRVYSADDAHFASEAVAGGGIPIVEITMGVTQIEGKSSVDSCQFVATRGRTARGDCENCWG